MEKSKGKSTTSKDNGHIVSERKQWGMEISSYNGQQSLKMKI